MNLSNPLGAFCLGSKTATAGTAITQFIPPYRGDSGARVLHKKVNGHRPNLRGVTHITDLVYTAGSTAHDVVLMRPFNWAYVNGAVAKNATAVVLTDDPGVYSTNYKYPLPAGQAAPAGTADNAIAAGDCVAVQLTDGTWHVTTVASGSYSALVLTDATPNITGGGIADGSIMYFFGVAANTDPATGLAHPVLTSVASTRVNLLQDAANSYFAALHAGDPLLVYSANASNAGILSLVSGLYF